MASAILGYTYVAANKSPADLNAQAVLCPFDLSVPVDVMGLTLLGPPAPSIPDAFHGQVTITFTGATIGSPDNAALTELYTAQLEKWLSAPVVALPVIVA